jgi:hypothetical protein
METYTLNVRVMRLSRPAACCAAAALFLAVAEARADEAASAGEVEVGDTPAEVVGKLGKPSGVLGRGGMMTYLYDRGTVDFASNRVVKAKLRSAAQARALKLEKERAEEERLRKAAAERARLEQEGPRVLQQKLADQQFAQRPASEQLAYWRDFQRTYPYTDVGAQIDGLQAAVEAERNAVAQAHELTTLKERLVAIDGLFQQLDTEYAASLAHWKRREINEERAKLTTERDAAEARIKELEGAAETNAASSAGQSPPP